MRTNLPVRMTGSFPSAMRRRTVFAEQRLNSAYSPTVSNGSGSAGRLVRFFDIGIMLLVLGILWHARTRCRAPEKSGQRKNRGMRNHGTLLQDCRAQLFRSPWLGRTGWQGGVGHLAVRSWHETTLPPTIPEI